MKGKGKEILSELKRHLPFTLTSSIAAIILVSIFYLINKEFFISKVPNFFGIMHPAHVLVSAIATSAIYHKYKKSLLFSILIGIVGSITIGTLSDIVFPFLLGNLFSLNTHLHLPIIEETLLIIGVSFTGSLIGTKWNLSKPSHSLHVFLSIFASLFYILTFSIEINLLMFALILLIVFLAVYIPCCISDIVFPLIFVKNKCDKCGHWH